MSTLTNDITWKHPEAGYLRISGLWKIKVDRGCLLIKGGWRSDRYEHRYEPETVRGELDVIMIDSPDGEISGRAITWALVNDVTIIMNVTGTEGTARPRWVVICGEEHASHARLRRAQAIMGTFEGLELANKVMGDALSAKCESQATAIAERGFTEEAARIRECASAIPEQSDPKAMRDLESRAADIYWATFQGHRWAYTDAKAEPTTWKSFAKRSNARGDEKKRSATDPTNAALNYAFALLDCATAVAIRATKLDPSMGVIHSDQPAERTNALGLELVEPARAEVTEKVLELLASRTLTTTGEQPDLVRHTLRPTARVGTKSTIPGQVTIGLKSQLARDLQALYPQMCRIVEPHVVRAAKTIAEYGNGMNERLIATPVKKGRKS